MSGFDMNFSQQGAKRWGFYAACSDHIASDYNSYGGGSFPDGTGVIGLLLIKKGAGAGAYEHYHLGSHRGGPARYQVNDAYAVRDPSCRAAQAHEGAAPLQGVFCHRYAAAREGRARH